MFGSNPSFCISRRALDYTEAARIYESLYNKKYDEANISDQPPGRTNYALVNIGGSIAFRMYRTHIITWREDGSIKYIEYDTGVTRNVQSTFGPLRIWRDSRQEFYNKTRFGPWGGTHYPFDDSTIDPEGFVHGLKDRKERIIASKKKERIALTRQFRKYAVPRILLGEFGNAFYRRDNGSGNGYVARVPRQDSTKRTLFQLFSENADNERIDNHLQNTEVIHRQVFGRKKGAQWYATAELAAFAAINSIIRTSLDSDEWREEYTIEYPPIQTRDL